MDILAHGLWGGVIFGWRNKFFWAALFGMLPDLLAFGPFFIYRIASGTFSFGKPELNSIPQIVFTSYNISHSLFTGLVIFLVVRFLVSKELSVAAGAYSLHILCDIPTHDQTFFPTPFLFPLSDVKVDGISWANRYFMLGNYLALIVAYWFYFAGRRKIKRESIYPSPEERGEK